MGVGPLLVERLDTKLPARHFQSCQREVLGPDHDHSWTEAATLFSAMKLNDASTNMILWNSKGMMGPPFPYYSHTTHPVSDSVEKIERNCLEMPQTSSIRRLKHQHPKAATNGLIYWESGPPPSGQKV